MSISIHAPLAGCDATVCIYQHSWAEFQSTHPLRGATGRALIEVNRALFQSTHPLRGATPKARRICWARTFQSTHPLRGATAGICASARRTC